MRNLNINGTYFCRWKPKNLSNRLSAKSLLFIRNEYMWGYSIWVWSNWNGVNGMFSALERHPKSYVFVNTGNKQLKILDLCTINRILINKIHFDISLVNLFTYYRILETEELPSILTWRVFYLLRGQLNLAVWTTRLIRDNRGYIWSRLLMKILNPILKCVMIIVPKIPTRK